MRINRKRSSDANIVYHCASSKEVNLPPFLSEYYVNCLWFETSELSKQQANPPLLDTKSKADVVIIGGGLTGLSTAYHMAKAAPSKQIIILEAAQCGWGASGRNGGHAIVYPLEHCAEIYHKYGLEAAKAYASISSHGIEIIQSLTQDENLNCDLEDTCNIVFAETEKHINHLVEKKKILQELGIESIIRDQDYVRCKFKTEKYFGGLESRVESMLDPAKLCIGLKQIVEDLGVTVYESTRITSLKPGKIIKVVTEFGEVEADNAVIATNGYSATSGLFKSRVCPVTNYVIATEPLSKDQIESIGWENRETMTDTRVTFDYFRLSADNRIVIGGEGVPYFMGNKLSSGNYKPIIATLEKRLFEIWPQLKGIKITHRWGGTLGVTVDRLPAFGVMGEDKNIFYGLGYTGEGVCWSQVAGKIISQLYSKKDTDLTRFFLTNTLPPYIPPEPFRKIGVEFFTRYLKFLND